MLNFEAVKILDKVEAQTGTHKFAKKLSLETFSEEEMNAAIALYEMANGIRPSLENGHHTPTSDFASSYDKKAKKKLGKRKLLEDGSTSRSRRKVEHLSEVHNANDHDDSSVRDLYNKAVAEKFGRQNVAAAGTSSKNRFKLLGSKPLQISAEIQFCVIRFLSAVRAALTTTFAHRSGRPLDNDHMINERNLPILNIHEIVQRVISKPGDPRVLQCCEPLIELVRGALKIFSLETPPQLGAAPWDPLTVYDRSRKRWKWIGPMPCSLNCTDLDASCACWGLSSENLAKLVDCFSFWLKRVQPTLLLIATLPEPPRAFMQEMDFNTRFNNRKKLNECTIRPSCDLVIAHFHREEAIRYLIPDRSFFYTALDGKKSAVAPLRKNNSKMLSRSRGHHIFKANRPPQFSLLSLVRDAAARLPGGVGTRTDICSLLRQSQYVIDDIPEKTVKQIVSGALDRLHGEVDPCVKHIGRHGLWVYLHKDREVEDFVEDGTSSSKKKGPK